MLSFKIEVESRHRFLFFIPRAFLEEWLSASVALNLQHAFACLIPDETCSFSAFFQFAHSHVCSSQEALLAPPTLPSLPRTRTHLRVVPLLNGRRDARSSPLA